MVYDAVAHTVYAHPVDQLAPDATYELRLRGGHGIPGASTTFTTESATGPLLRIRAQLDSGLAYALAGIAPGARGLQIDADVPAAGTTLSYTADTGSIGGLHTSPVPNTSATGAARYVFGSYLAPSWLNGDTRDPDDADAPVRPGVRGQARLPFVLIVPGWHRARGRVAGRHLRPRVHRLRQQRVPRRRPQRDCTASRPSAPTSSATASAR